MSIVGAALSYWGIPGVCLRKSVTRQTCYLLPVYRVLQAYRRNIYYMCLSVDCGEINGLSCWINNSIDIRPHGNIQANISFCPDSVDICSWAVWLQTRYMQRGAKDYASNINLHIQLYPFFHLRKNKYICFRILSKC